MNSKRILSVCLCAALLTSTLSAVPAMAEDAVDFSTAMTERFSESEMQYRPYARWWLAEGSHTDETLKESIQELYDAGFGGVEFVTLTSEAEILDDATYGWGSPEWIHDSKVIIDSCAELGMSVSMTGGTYWATANLPNITPDEQTASQELGYTTVELKDSQGSFDGVLPQCILPGEATKQTLVSVVAAKVLDWSHPLETEEPAAEEVPTEDEEAAPIEGEEEVPIPMSKTLVDTDSLEVVTDQVTDNGDGTYNISYTPAEEGDYILFAFYQYGTSESYAASANGVSYTINYFDPAGAEAMKAYWDENVLTDEVMELISKIDEADLYMDSLELETKGENSTRQLWCTDMLSQFQERRGYDLEKYLPLLIRETPDGIGGMGMNLTYVFDFTDSSEKNIDYLRNDFFQTETELYSENCLLPLKTWLNEKGMYLRAENSYGKTFEVSQTVPYVDYLETESFEFGGEIDSYRNFSGPAHLYGKRLSSESGAAIFTNYLYNNGYYRQLFYTQYASGIQKTVTHGYSSPYGPEEHVNWPGYEGMTDLISERFNKRQPGSVDYPELNAHLSRIQEVLEQGVPQVDIAMLRTDYYLNNLLTNVSNAGYENNRLHNDEAYYWMDQELQNNGYTYEYFSPYAFDDDCVSVEGGLINADGVAYKALILMEDELPLSAAEKILTAAQNGLPVLFVNNVVEDTNNDHVMKENTTAASTTGRNDEDAEALASVIEKIKALPNVATVDNEADAMEALQELHVTARVAYPVANNQILTTLRKGEDASYLYVYNYKYTDDASYQGQISIEGTYAPYVLDTWTGDISYAGGTSEDGRTILDITLEPGDVAVYLLDPNEEAAPCESPTEGTVVELNGWNLQVDSYVPGDKLTRTEENAETGVTTTEVTFDTAHVTLDAGTLDTLVPWKDIEAIGENVSGVGTYTTTFTLEDGFNEVLFHAGSFNYGTASMEVNGSPVPVNMDTTAADLTSYVQAGENTITVNVTSSLRNILLQMPYIFWFGITGTQPDAYGMTGETTLTIR